MTEVIRASSGEFKLVGKAMGMSSDRELWAGRKFYGAEPRRGSATLGHI